MTFDAANRERDRRLRRRILHLARLAMPVSPEGDISGRMIVDTIQATCPDQFEDDSHALGLLREMVGKGYLVERDTRTRKDQRFGLEWLRYRISEKGIGLWNESVAPDPDVDDERLSGAD